MNTFDVMYLNTVILFFFNVCDYEVFKFFFNVEVNTFETCEMCIRYGKFNCNDRCINSLKVFSFSTIKHFVMRKINALPFGRKIVC